MPSLATHHFFAKEVYNNLDENDKKYFQNNLDIYYLFAQSHDVLYFHKLNLKTNKIASETASKGHHKNTQEYLLNIIKIIKEEHLEYNPEVLSYLFGSTTHYVLDSTCHPFIFYKTGIYRKSDKGSIKYNGEHSRMEKDIDAYYYEKYQNKKYNKANLNKEFIRVKELPQKLSTVIDKAYYNTYKIEKVSSLYQNGLRDFRIVNFLVSQDRLGIKRGIYHIIDFLTFKHLGNIAAYSNHILKPDKKWLNEEHKEWHNPADKSITSTESFEDLYNKALKKNIKIIEEINKVLYDDKPIEEIKKYIPDIDYSTGLNVKNNPKMIYFEY